MIDTFFRLVFGCFMLSLAHLCEAKVKLPAFFSDGMVLQREQAVSLWGKADVGEKVTVIFRNETYQARADQNGEWSILLSPTKAGGPYDMTVNEMRIQNILIGDVYLCSGQSNMELPVSRVLDLYQEEVNSYSNPMIRHLKVPLSYDFHQPQDDIKPTSWQELNPQNALQFSALAYFFAQEMYAKNGIPVGLINSSVGGSPVEAWISEEKLKPFPKYLNEGSLYKSDAYIASVRETEQMRRMLWHNILYGNDKGMQAPLKWYDSAYKDTDWQEIDLFDTWWNNNGLNPINGSHWFRKEIDIPIADAGKPAVLRLGCVVDADSVFVNGVFVGSVSYQYPPRIYQLPEGLLKAGKNLVTVRLVSYNGRPHFVREKPYKIIIDNTEVSLEGTWKYKLGTPMPDLPGETFFQYKPAGLNQAMIAPLKDYALKGVIWYQGESNVGRHNEYFDLLTAMIADWRQQFNNPRLPFVLVELAGFGDPADKPMQEEWAAFRKVQKQVAESVPGAALVKAEDLGEWNDIHPLNKKEVGIRVVTAMEKLITGE